MTELILEPTSTAQWHRLIREASAESTHELDEELESYLVFLLMRYCRDPDMTKRVMALDFLESLNAQGQTRTNGLRDVGDQCLIYAGVFPHMAQRRLVRVSYFVDLGRTAYHELSEFVSAATGTLYRELANAFVTLMEVLHQMCELNGTRLLQPIEAVELWQDTGSLRARKTLRATTQKDPVWTHAPQRMH